MINVGLIQSLILTLNHNGISIANYQFDILKEFYITLQRLSFNPARSTTVTKIHLPIIVIQS